MINTIFNIGCDYIRLVSYAAIIFLALNGIFKKRFSNAYFLGDVVMALGLLLAGFHTNILGKRGALIADAILTPAALFWAIVHFDLFLKQIRGKNKAIKT